MNCCDICKREVGRLKGLLLFADVSTLLDVSDDMPGLLVDITRTKKDQSHRLLLSCVEYSTAG